MTVVRVFSGAGVKTVHEFDVVGLKEVDTPLDEFDMPFRFEVTPEQDDSDEHTGM